MAEKEQKGIILSFTTNLSRNAAMQINSLVNNDKY